eukprot:4215396-Prymnesium_polylepis.1
MSESIGNASRNAFAPVPRRHVESPFCTDPKRQFCSTKTITLREEVNQEAAQFLMSLDKQQWKELVGACLEEESLSEKKPTQKDISQAYREFKRFLASALGHPNGVKRKYTHAIGCTYGRRYTPRGLQRVKRAFRGVLCRGEEGNIYTDVDAINACFEILLQLCKADGLSTPELESYVRQRDDRLRAVMEHFQCSRDDAKDRFFKTAFWHKLRNYGEAFLHRFDAEMKLIQRHFLNKHEYQFLKRYGADVSNLEGRFLSDIYRFHEGQMLDAIYEFMTTDERYNAIEMGMLAFDGLQLYGEHSDAQLLADMTAAVRSATGFKLHFAYKPFDETIDVPEDFVYHGFLTYAQKALEFDQGHVKCGDMFVKRVERGGEIKHKFLSEAQMRSTYAHIAVMDDEGEEVNFISEWLRNNNDMRVFEEMDVYPNPVDAEHNPDVYNLWTPFAMDLELERAKETGEELPWDEEGLQLILDHISVICNHEQRSIDFLIDWMANMVQFPWNKSLMPVLIGLQGCGKTWLVKLLRCMMGAAKVFETTDPQGYVFGQFNSAMKDCFLVNLSEVGGKDVYEAYNKFKALVTDPELWINGKGKEHVKITSYHHWITTTNNEDPLPTDDDDRRAALIR